MRITARVRRRLGSPNLGDAVKLSPFVRMVVLPGPVGIPETQAANFFEAQVRAAILDLNRRGIGVAALLIDSIFSSDGVWSILPASSPAELRRYGRPVVSSSPTKSSRALVEPAPICGDLSATGSFRTLLRSANRWGTDFRSGPLLVARARWSILAPPLATPTRLPATRSE